MKLFRYFGISYPQWLCHDVILKFWKRFMCERNIHLFDEVFSDTHYLHCDACSLMVEITCIDTEYCDTRKAAERIQEQEEWERERRGNTLTD